MNAANAPGKLVIVGDYAVLEGAPAIATTVDVRARAQVVVTESNDSLFIDLAGGKSYRFIFDQGLGLSWIDESPAERGTLLEAVLRTVYEQLHLTAPLPAMRISINTDAFFQSVDGVPVKLGLGSSAAALVALAGGLMSALNISIEPGPMLKFCQAAHRHFQGGYGSGIDISAAFHGGVVGVTIVPGDVEREIEALSWPDGLHMLPLWSGVSASTPVLLQRFAAFREADSSLFQTHMRRLTRFARQTVEAWHAGAVSEIMSSLAGYDGALRMLDEVAKIGINTPTHEQLRRIVERHGAVYKTSGAGGGDFGIAISESSDVVAAIKAEANARGLLVLEKSFCVDGLRRGG
jgi:phosphomevalonate kinase